MTTTINIQTSDNYAEITVNTYDQEGSGQPTSVDTMGDHESRTIHISGNQAVTVREIKPAVPVDDDPEN